DVLLKHGPPVVASADELREHIADARPTIAERPEKAARDGVRVPHASFANRGSERRVGVLEMDVTDAMSVVARDRDRIAAADEHVPRVEAERDVALREKTRHRATRLDRRTEVRMHRDVEAASPGDLPHAWQRGKEGVPLSVVELDRRVVAVASARRGEDEDLRADVAEPRGLSLDLRQREIERVATVQHTRDEAADDAYAPFADQLEGGARIAREEARWSGLHIAQTQARGLFEDAPKGQLVSPAGHLADAPRDRRGGESHVRTLASV